MVERAKSFGQLLLAGLVSGGVLSAILGFVLAEQSVRVEEQVKNEFQTAFRVFGSQRAWKERSLAELLGPVDMQLRRTKLAFKRWDSQNLYLETKIMREGNETARDLLLSKGHLIPPDLVPCAGRLIEHYDVWLEKFEEKRAAEKPDLETTFLFVGPEGFPFPRDCELKFRQTYRALWREVYGEG